MTLVEVAVIVFGLFAGYWVVSKLFFRPSLRVQAPPVAQEWYQVLNVSPAASAEEIRAAYRQLISLYHPDKVQQLGPELQELATRKSQEITAAYEKGLQATGERV
jgi:preprotein translocase subunit Sec63